MARPAKSVNVKSGTITKAEENARQAAENALKGESNKLKAPKYLTVEQKKVFNYIIENLDEAKILGNLDIFILSRAAITVCQLQELDKKANSNPDIIFDTKYRMAKDAATKDFFRICNELCLSPQSRAKISISAAKAEPEKMSLMDILNADDD